MRKRPIIERFAEKYSVDQKTGCWKWTGAKIAGGYGHLRRYQQEPILAHRFSYEHHYGSIQPGMIVRHKCSNPSCVNPAHLELGTHEDNMADMVRAGRRLGRNGGSALDGKTLNTMKCLLEAGHLQKDIAKTLGVHRSTILRTVNRGDLEQVELQKKRSVRTYLSNEQKAEAIRMLEEGCRVMTVATYFGVDRKTIRNLRPQHIPPPPSGRPRSPKGT